MFLPAEIIPVLAHFAPVFTAPTYQKALVLVVGTILAKGRRTVTSALRAVGHTHSADWAKYHHVLNRAQWSGLALSARLLLLLVATWAPVGGITVDVDETLERRWGPRIRKRGHWRDSLASSKQVNVSSSGLRWLVFALVVNVPWTPYALALPFLSVLLTTPKVSAQLGRRHKTVAHVTGQAVIWRRRTLPGRAIQLVGDGAYAVITLGALCQRQQVVLLAPLRLDARLFEPPMRRAGKQRGRPRVVGARLPNLEQVAGAPTTRWQRSLVPWYGGTHTVVDWTTGTALWYTTGTPPLAIRWVLVRDPQGERATRAFFSTETAQGAPNMIADFVQRWPLEVTFQEARAHLGLETQASGAIWRLSAPRRHSWASSRWWFYWPRPCTRPVTYRCRKPPGIPKHTPPSTMSWHSCGGASGRSSFFRQLHRQLICDLSARPRSITCFLRPVISL